MSLITADRVRELFVYDPETGAFTRKFKTHLSAIGSIVGTLSGSGYLVVNNCRRIYSLHRLAFLYMTGAVPAMVDHVNGVRTDNRWANLRATTPMENVQNRRLASKNSKLGILGVYAYKKRFVARIMHHRQPIHIGVFDTPEIAHEAYLAAKRRIHQACTI